MFSFSSHEQMYRKSYCTTPGIGVGGEVSKMLQFYIKVLLCVWQGAVRQAILNADRSCSKVLYAEAAIYCQKN